ncbi:MAG TPA: hypothetical protein VGK82_09115 [Pyrinomonadaceae bacterium]
MNRVSTAEVLNKAYRLAYFLHQDKDVAIRIVTAATLKLNVALAVQSKRLYYVPVGRFSRGESRRTDGIRSKALFSDLHLLQRLLYVESESYERQKERAAQLAPPGVRAVGDPASEEDLLVYFIKHLVRITTKRNSFYVTLGVSRLLHSYSTLETMEIYNAVIGEPERVKDDYYYRSRKAVLMHEMYQRFGELIRVCRQRRGEERFETQPGTSEQRSLIRECLRVFTPWDTQCSVPSDFDPLKSVIASLVSRRNADENEVEVNRIHAVLHPKCFERLVAAFGYSAPEERMELPRFFMDQSDDESPPRPRSAPADLSAEELAEINHVLDEQAGRRRRSAGAMRIFVDGIERGRLNPAEQSSISFSVEEDVEVIEVKTTDSRGELLLATHLLTSFGKDAPDATIVSSIRLEGGQELSLSITRRESEANGRAELLVQFGYRETNPLRAVRLRWQRLGLWKEVRIAPGLPARHVLVVVSVVFMAVLSYLAYVRLRSKPTVGPASSSIAQVTPFVENHPQANDKINQPAGPITQPTRRGVNKSTAAKAPAGNATPDEEGAVDATRGGSVVANIKLREVKKIYIEIRGDTKFDELRSNLLESLSSSGVITATTDANDADAALKIVVTQTSAGQIEASARLVNARGVVLWPNAGGARRYSGEPQKVLSDLLNDLLSAVRLARPEGTAH